MVHRAERHQTVEDAQAERQRVRTANLAKRKEDAKGGKKKKAGKARPGFEGGRPAKAKSSSSRATGPGGNGGAGKGKSGPRKGKPFARPS
jgi:hypothetical protein